MASAEDTVQCAHIVALDFTLGDLEVLYDGISSWRNMHINCHTEISSGYAVITDTTKLCIDCKIDHNTTIMALADLKQSNCLQTFESVSLIQWHFGTAECKHAFVMRLPIF